MQTHRPRTWMDDTRFATAKLSRRARHQAARTLGWGRGLWWQLRHARFGIKPGWMLLLVLLGLYALWATFALWGAKRELAQLKPQTSSPQSKLPIPANPSTNRLTLSWPLDGASAPSSRSNLPGALRNYRNGVSQGYTFTGNDSGVRVRYGMPVLAAADGKIIRADTDHLELRPNAYLQLLRDVKRGADASQLNRLRGRQVWLQHADGTVTRYGHLSGLASGLSIASSAVKRGQTIGFVGNSGTLEGAKGTQANARLQFEVWQNERYLGDKLSAAQVRAATNSLFR